MSLQVRIIVGCIAFEARCFHHIFQYVFHVTVYYFHRQVSVKHRLSDFLTLRQFARHQEVVARFHLQCSMLSAVPVGHHHTREAPFVAQNLCHKVAAFACHRAVHLIIRSHDSPGLGFLDGNLERLEVNLAERARSSDDIVARAVGLLVVECEMLQRCPHAVALHTVYHGSADFSCKQRVFRVVLEVTSVERIAVDVGCRSKQHVHSVVLHLVTHCHTYALDESGVPRGAHNCSHGEMGAIKSL